MTTEDGMLIENPVLEVVVPALDTYKHRQLVVLGERCCGHDELVNELMVAMAMAMSLDADAVIQQPWFQQVGTLRAEAVPCCAGIT